MKNNVLLLLLAQFILVFGSVDITHRKDSITKNNTRSSVYNGDYTLSVFTTGASYSDELATSWHGSISSLSKDVEIASYTIAQFENYNANLQAGVIKKRGWEFAKVVITLDKVFSSSWTATSYSPDFMCAGYTCTSLYSITDQEDLHFGFTFSVIKNVVYVFSKQLEGSTALIGMWENTEDLGGLFPWGYMFTVSNVALCTELPNLSFTMLPSYQIDNNGAIKYNDFEEVTTSIQHICNVQVEVDSQSAIVTMSPEAESNPEIIDVPEIQSVPSSTCAASSWQTIKKDCDNGSKYCDSNVWFSANMHFPQSVPASDEWTNLYYPFMMTDQTERITQQYYAYYTPIGYTGFQPRTGGGVQFIFSTFSANTNPLSENCHSGADGWSDGVSCSVTVDGIEANEVFYVRITRVGNGAVFQGEVLYKDRKVLIGKYSFDDASMVDSPSVNVPGFIENYTSSNKMNSCCDCRKADAVVFAPFSTDAGGSYGEEMSVGQYGSTCTPTSLHLGWKNYEFELEFEDGVVVPIAGSHIWKGWQDADVRSNFTLAGPAVRRLRVAAPFNVTIEAI